MKGRLSLMEEVDLRSFGVEVGKRGKKMMFLRDQKRIKLF